ncbi:MULTISPECIES: adenylate/guanylate cyclase domain-containing protein [Blastococcus]|uniref:adenylate/guanylate cyclase domain-containing protein n=1 Tax=Blastococcus TaxID=38501 RepID=UPI000591415B|nr:MULTISPECIES: adenylate/guanylate cyclase domain-containing protein [Blastococcus]TKJ29513.1 hypothetical protein A6V29_19350 [Blastococcus sp. CCUG 61487]
MDSNYKTYSYTNSFNRLDQYLDAPAGNYEETDSLPSRDKLTYGNGYYANCAAMFVDLRDSSSLPASYKRPVLAKIYRSFISEVVAIMNSDLDAREINIVGDCVWGVFDTTLKTDVDDLFSRAAEVNSMMKVLRYKMEKKDYKTPVKAGIGLSYGRALMIKAGYNGSGISDVVYMGDVVNQAAKLAAQGSKGWNQPIYADGVFYQNLNEYNQGLLKQITWGGPYSGWVVNIAMENWYTENCK